MFCSSVEAVAYEAWAGGWARRAEKSDATFEHLRAVEAVSPRSRFQGLIERHEPRLRRLAFGVLTDKSRVDDVLQEAFIRAFRKLPDRFENERQEAAWLYRIVYRCCLNELRSTRRRREMPAPVDEEQAAPAGEPSDSLWVASALAALPADQRAVVLLVDLLGFDYETAASILRAPRGTIAWRLNVARSRLRDVLGEEGEGV